MRLYLTATVAVITMVFPGNLSASAQSSAPVCRNTEVETDGVSQTIRMCRDANGSWQIVPNEPSSFAGLGDSNQSGDVLPPGFSGRIAYRGTYEGATTPVPRGRQRGNLGTLLGNAIGANSTPIGGTYDVELTFEPGGRVSGRASGSGRASSVTWAGTRNGSQCRLFASPGGGIVEGTCTRSRFVAISTSSPTEQRTRYRVDLNLQAVQVADSAAVARPPTVGSGTLGTAARIRLPDWPPPFDPALARPFASQFEWLSFCAVASLQGQAKIEIEPIMEVLNPLIAQHPEGQSEGFPDLVWTRWLALTTRDQTAARQTLLRCQNTQ